MSIPSFMPPRRRWMAVPEGVPNQSSEFVRPLFGGRGSQDCVGGEDSTRVDLLRRRAVLPPISMDRQLSQDLCTDAGHVDVDEEFPRDAMNSGSYFLNLMSNGFSDTPVYGQPDDIPQPEDSIGQGHAAAVVKGHQKRSKNFSVEEDTLLVSAWINVKLDAVQGVDQSKSTY